MDAGGWSCGMVAGLIHDIPTVKQLIDRIMSEAERSSANGSKRFLGGPPQRGSPLLPDILHFIDGAADAGEGDRFGDIFDPNTGVIQARVRSGHTATVDRAVPRRRPGATRWAEVEPAAPGAGDVQRSSAWSRRAWTSWRALLSSQHGKVIADSKGDIQRGLEVIEFACGIPHVLKGEYTYGAGPGIDVYSMRQPLGVGAGITPFNFPAMIPMWMFGVAIACGNAFILKPSEKDPGVPVRLGRAVHGSRRGRRDRGQRRAQRRPWRRRGGERHPRPSRHRRVSFVGSSDIAHHVYRRGAEAGKRVQAMGGAKNHAVVLPDADIDLVKDLSGAAFGSAGERCMALPVAVHGRQEDRRRRFASAWRPRWRA